MNGVTWGEVDLSVRPERVVIVASGLSLKGFNFHRLLDRGYYVISVNGAGNVVPSSDAWITIDPWGLDDKQLPKKKVKKLYAAVPEDFGTPFAKAQSHQIVAPEHIIYLKRVSVQNGPVPDMQIGVSGFPESPDQIVTGNSGYGALNLAYYLRPKKVLLLGIDAGSGYFYTTARSNRSLWFLPQLFASAVPQLRAAGIEVINGSKDSRVKAFPRYGIQEALEVFDA